MRSWTKSMNDFFVFVTARNIYSLSSCMLAVSKYKFKLETGHSLLSDLLINIQLQSRYISVLLFSINSFRWVVQNTISDSFKLLISEYLINPENPSTQIVIVLMFNKELCCSISLSYRFLRCSTVIGFVLLTLWQHILLAASNIVVTAKSGQGSEYPKSLWQNFIE